MLGALCRGLVVGLILLGSALANPVWTENATRQVKTKTDPVYPELARKMHIAGTVKIEVTINPNGTIKSTKVIGGNPVLVEAALEAVKKWRFDARGDETTQIVEFRFEGQ